MFQRFIRFVYNFFIDIRVGGIPLAGTIQTPFKELGATDTANSAYMVLREIFDRVDVKKDDILVDVGCGKGRVLNWWILHFPKNQIVGIELDSKVADFTRKRLRRYKNCEVITGNILDNIPLLEKGTLFYLYNPFNESVMREFERALTKTKTERSIRIIYRNSRHLNVFKESERWKIEKIQGKVMLPSALITYSGNECIRTDLG